MRWRNTVDHRREAIGKSCDDMDETNEVVPTDIDQLLPVNEEDDSIIRDNISGFTHLNLNDDLALKTEEITEVLYDDINSTSISQELPNDKKFLNNNNNNEKSYTRYTYCVGDCNDEMEDKEYNLLIMDDVGDVLHKNYNSMKKNHRFGKLIKVNRRNLPDNNHEIKLSTNYTKSLCRKSNSNKIVELLSPLSDHVNHKSAQNFSSRKIRKTMAPSQTICNKFNIIHSNNCYHENSNRNNFEPCRTIKCNKSQGNYGVQNVNETQGILKKLISHANQPGRQPATFHGKRTPNTVHRHLLNVTVFLMLEP